MSGLRVITAMTDGGSGSGRRDSRPVVDVGVPTWGRPQYLRETIESVLAQTFQRWRLTVSENGPGDEEIRAIVEPYLDDSRVRHVPTGSEISAPENATRAIEAGDAPFVALLHDDDRWDPEFLARGSRSSRRIDRAGLCSLIAISSTRSELSCFTGACRSTKGFSRETRSFACFIPITSSRCRRFSLGEPPMTWSDPRSAPPCYSTTVNVDANFRALRCRLPGRIRRLLPDSLASDDASGTSSEGRASARTARRDRRLPPQDFPPIDRRRAYSGAHLRASFDAFGGRAAAAAAHLLEPSGISRRPAGPQDGGDDHRRAEGLRARHRRLWKRSTTESLTHETC